MFHATSDRTESVSSSSVQRQEPCRQFKLSEIRLATQNFDKSLVIGRGGFGKVYLGIFVNGERVVVAAVKRLDSLSNQGATEFWTEVDMLSKLQHCHIVSLVGYCNDGKEMILVYDYMSRGTLEDHLHKFCTPLSWLQRLKICISAARGLEYLHTGMGTEHRVIHRDVKSSNILLHESWAAKISDFGLSRIGQKDQPTTHVTTNVKGSFGYLDPNYYRTGRLTRKSDVYAFGVLLFEVLCRKRAVDGSPDDEEWGLARWVHESIKQGTIRHIIDPELRDQISSKCLKDFVRTTHPCLHDDPKKRPTMADVVLNLEAVLALQEKTNSSLHHAGKTIFGRMNDMFSFTSKGELSAKRYFSEATGHFSIPFYRYKEIEKATNSFSKKQRLGIGTYSTVYAGKLNNDEWVAVKKFQQRDTDETYQASNEIKLISSVNHPNLVRLLGCCIEEGEQILVYELMPNGTLSQHLQRERGRSLPWTVRLDIATETAQAIAHLHSFTNPPIYHRDIKSSHILLDYNFNSKVAGFGLSRLGMLDGSHILTAPQGTPGYVYPQYHENFHLSDKNDVYSFGVVLVEIITALKVFDFSGHQIQFNVAALAILRISKGRLEDMIDLSLEPNKDAWTLSSIYKVAELAFRCLAFDMDMRPSMIEVEDELEQIRQRRWNWVDDDVTMVSSSP